MNSFGISGTLKSIILHVLGYKILVLLCNLFVFLQIFPTIEVHDMSAESVFTSKKLLRHLCLFEITHNSISINVSVHVVVLIR